MPQPYARTRCCVVDNACIDWPACACRAPLTLYSCLAAATRRKPRRAPAYNLSRNWFVTSTRAFEAMLQVHSTLPSDLPNISPISPHDDADDHRLRIALGTRHHRLRIAAGSRAHPQQPPQQPAQPGAVALPPCCLPAACLLPSIGVGFGSKKLSLCTPMMGCRRE